MIKNGNKLERIAVEVEDKENQLDHLNNQREALIENYIKG